MKKTSKKLSLGRETVQNLSTLHLAQVQGAGFAPVYATIIVKPVPVASLVCPTNPCTAPINTIILTPSPVIRIGY